MVWFFVVVLVGDYGCDDDYVFYYFLVVCVDVDECEVWCYYVED